MNNMLDMPFNLARVEHETILKDDSGINDWKEDVQHLHNQLQREKVGTCAGRDWIQRKKDNRKLLLKLRADAKQVNEGGGDNGDDAKQVNEGGDDWW